MRIYLPEIMHHKGEPVNFRFEGKIPDHFGVSQSGDGNLSLNVVARSSGDKVIVSGTLEAAMDTECSRCLKPSRQSFKSDFQEAFTLVPGLSERDDAELLAAEAANQLTVTGDYLYLDEYLRQVFILAQVYNPLCKPDCKGICAGCGAELNISSCRCKTEQEPDARLAKLKELEHGS